MTVFRWLDIGADGRLETSTHRFSNRRPSAQSIPTIPTMFCNFESFQLLVPKAFECQNSMKNIAVAYTVPDKNKKFPSKKLRPLILKTSILKFQTCSDSAF